MDYCDRCGKKLNRSNDFLCPACRREAGGKRGGGRSAARRFPAVDAPIGLTKQEFRKSYSKGIRLCNIAAIFGYAGAAAMLGIVLYFFRDFSAVVFVDVSFVLLLALFVHLTRNRTAAIIYLAFCALNAVIYLVTEGRFVGMLPLVGAVMAVVGTIWYDREWRAYQEMYDPESD